VPTRLSLACLAIALGSAGCSQPATDAPPPRLLVVTIDTLRADHVGAYGGPVPTPAIDSLARDGALLLDAATPTPTTGPAHATLWTGLHPWRHGASDNAVPVSPSAPLVSETAQAAGIATAAFVSSYVLDARFGFARGFATFHFEPDQHYAWRGRERDAFWTRGAATTDAALAWLRDHRSGPFLVWVHYFDPHAPYTPPAGFERPANEVISLDGKTLPPGLPSFAHLKDSIRGYRGDVAYTDFEVGRLFEGMRALDLLGTTAIVVTADHGEGLGDHGVLEHGENLYDELVRIPLVVRAPGIDAGQRLAGPAQLEDLAPTVLELLQLPVPAGLDGTSLLPWLRGAVAASPRDTAIGRRKPYRNEPELFFTRGDGKKWIGAPDDPGRSFDLATDPHERNGVVAPAPAAVVDAARTVTTPAAALQLDAESRRALEALGYLKE
jgi:arylsulfatase A-like enzyme